MLSPARRALLLLALCAVPAVCGAASASAAVTSSTSDNWSGYIAGNGPTFKQVYGRWTVPKIDCSGGHETSSSNWVGIGGVGEDSKALEQVGTDSNCLGNGKTFYAGWFEVYPARSHYPPSMHVRPGDRMTAKVVIRGHDVTMSLYNLTRHHHFRATLHVPAVDQSTAEWIMEATPKCTSSAASSCNTLPLANFGTTGFTSSLASTEDGHLGTIADPSWDAVALSLAPDGKAARSKAAGHGLAGPLSADGASFGITWGAGALPAPDPAATTPTPAAGGRIAAARALAAG